MTFQIKILGTGDSKRWVLNHLSHALNLGLLLTVINSKLTVLDCHVQNSLHVPVSMHAKTQSQFQCMPMPLRLPTTSHRSHERRKGSCQSYLYDDQWHQLLTNVCPIPISRDLRLEVFSEYASWFLCKAEKNSPPTPTIYSMVWCFLFVPSGENTSLNLQFSPTSSRCQRCPSFSPWNLLPRISSSPLYR
ncbi:hypothetical protein VNO77_03569 [Canavalia gladiata]|uniref:Uncharacterized protein n=1 Tax=Canavalia gladiata TaxID=3824 RepID=A0AAN9MVR5_CANGL